MLISLLTLSACAGPQKNGINTSSTIEEMMKEATIAELADFFINTADDYNSKISRTELIEGFKESDIANRIQMLVMASRAFGELPKPSKGAQRLAPMPTDLTNVPEWALNDLQNINQGGILTASDLGLEPKENNSESESIQSESMADTGALPEPDYPTSDGKTDSHKAASDKMLTPVSLKDAMIITARFYAYYGKNLKDDFCATVNKNAFDNTEIAKGEIAGGSAEVTATTNKQLQDLILEIVNGDKEYLQGSPEQKIKTLYQNVLNVGARNQAGVTPLKKYFDAVNSSNTFKELYDAIALAVNELGNPGNGIFSMISVTDTKDNKRNVMQLFTAMPMLTSQDYANPDSAALKEYRNTLIEQLLIVGENKQEAERLADKMVNLEKNLSSVASNTEEKNNQSEPTIYTPQKLDEMLSQAKPSQLFTSIGLSKDTQLQVFNDKQFAAYAKWFTEENLDLFKAMQKVNLLSSFSKYLSPELAEKYGYESADQINAADNAVKNYLSDELGQLYVKRHFSEESKAEIEKMVKMMVDVFKERIQRLEWMDESTKQEALKKLDSLTVLIGYPETWEFNSADFKNMSEGGSYFENVAASEQVKWQKMVEQFNQPVDQKRFPLAAYTVNAAANRNTNTLIFPAGILQAPFYDSSASFEENLGANGTTIAHEITHLFDDSGAQYDAEGNMRNWWGKSDYNHFQTLCKQVEAAYNGHEAAPGINISGKEQLSENIADIGGMACALEILSKMENPNYDAFFRSYATQWLRVTDYETLASKTGNDEHSPNNLRCNIVLSNFQEFFDTYDISSKDGMYVAPENRIKIW